MALYSCLARYDLGYVSNRNTAEGSYFKMCQLGAFANGVYLSIRELGLWERFPLFLATLRDHIGGIICLGSQKQMGRVYTPRNVAFMQYAQVAGNWPIYQFPRSAVSGQQSPSSRFWASFVNLAVAKRRTSTIPLPTSRLRIPIGFPFQPFSEWLNPVSSVVYTSRHGKILRQSGSHHMEFYAPWQ